MTKLLQSIGEPGDSQTEYHMLMDALDVGISKHLINEEFTMIWANDCFYQKIGYSAQECRTLSSCSSREFLRDAAELFAPLIAEAKAAMKRGDRKYEVVFRMPRRDSAPVWHRVVGVFTDQVVDGCAVLYAVFTDIDAMMEQQALQKKLEEQSAILRQALTMAEQSSLSKTEFLSRMSHDIRTPLNAIIGMLAIAQENEGDVQKVSDCLGKMTLSAKFLLSLINDILDMSRIESGKVILNKKQFDFTAFLQNLALLFGAQAQERGLHLTISSDGTPHDTYIGDETKLNQILMNLLGNAIKFTSPGGKVTLDVSAGKQTAHSAELIFAVTDTGAGIPATFLEKLFLPFEQVGVQRDAFGGSGLGLAIASNFARMMNGDISVESVYGKGSTFTASVWLDTASQEAEQEDAPQQMFVGLRALVAEQDHDACAYAAGLLRDLGVQTDVSDCTLRVLEMLERAQENAPYDLVIAGLQFQRMSGITLAKEIRSRYGESPIVALSAYDWSALRAKALDAGVSHLLQKPLRGAAVYELLLSLLKNAQKAPSREPVSLPLPQGKCVLLVEDNDCNLEIAQTLLESRGLCVKTARNGREGVEKFYTQPSGTYSAILMDIQMPEMDGLCATAQIRMLPHRDAKQIPIIAMSANAFEEDVAKSIEAGMNAYIFKPIDVEVLMQTLRRFL